ncbi:unnamed protein product [Phaeothamnion confervicola]
MSESSTESSSSPVAMSDTASSQSSPIPATKLRRLNRDPPKDCPICHDFTLYRVASHKGEVFKCRTCPGLTRRDASVRRTLPSFVISSLNDNRISRPRTHRAMPARAMQRHSIEETDLQVN